MIPKSLTGYNVHWSPGENLWITLSLVPTAQAWLCVDQAGLYVRLLAGSLLRADHQQVIDSPCRIGAPWMANEVEPGVAAHPHQRRSESRSRFAGSRCRCCRSMGTQMGRQTLVRLGRELDGSLLGVTASHRGQHHAPNESSSAAATLRSALRHSEKSSGVVNSTHPCFP